MAAITGAASTSTDRELVITRIFDAPRELVFKAWRKDKADIAPGRLRDGCRARSASVWLVERPGMPGRVFGAELKCTNQHMLEEVE